MILSEQNLITEKELSLDLVVTLDQGSFDQPIQRLQGIEREAHFKGALLCEGSQNQSSSNIGDRAPNPLS